MDVCHSDALMSEHGRAVGILVSPLLLPTTPNREQTDTPPTTSQTKQKSPQKAQGAQACKEAQLIITSETPSQLYMLPIKPDTMTHTQIHPLSFTHELTPPEAAPPLRD